MLWLRWEQHMILAESLIFLYPKWTLESWRFPAAKHWNTLPWDIRSMARSKKIRQTDFCLIISITKFSIMIGSPSAYLACKRRVMTWVSNYRCLIWTFFDWIPVIGYSHDLRALWWFPSQCFLPFSKSRRKRYSRFRTKIVLRRHF